MVAHLKCPGHPPASSSSPPPPSLPRTVQSVLPGKGRIVRSYFEGHGNFLGMIVSKIPERPVVWVVYTDGGGEELYLDQLLSNLQPVTRSVQSSQHAGLTAWPNALEDAGGACR